jgi:hypothetical protein
MTPSSAGASRSAGVRHRGVQTDALSGASIEVFCDNPAMYTWYDWSADSPIAALTCWTNSRIDSQHPRLVHAVHLDRVAFAAELEGHAGSSFELEAGDEVKLSDLVIAFPTRRVHRALLRESN